MTGWPALAESLALELAGLPAGAIVKVIESGTGPRRFAQFLQLDNVLHAELATDTMLGPQMRAGEAGQQAIRNLGWNDPDNSHHNRWADLRWPALSADYHRIATMAIDGLVRGFGISGPEVLVYDAWNERDRNRAIELPLLGLTQAN